MTEDHESAADEQPRRGNTAPGLEGEGGQYMDGDYGEAGAVEAPAENLEDGEYPDGDYGDAGTVGTGRLTDGRVNTAAEDRGPLPGDSDR